MSEALVFYNPRKGSCPIYVQDDVSVGLVKPTKELIENFGGLVVEDPQKAIIIIIVDRNTHLGSKLITEHAGESSCQGVVDQAWVLETIRQSRMLGPPEWGGHALRRHTAQTYFDDANENTSSMVHTASSVTVDGIDSCLQPAGHAPLPSSGSLASLPTFRAQTNPPAHQEPAISLRPFLLQKDPPKRSKSAIPQTTSTLPLKSNKKSTLQKANKRTQGIRTESRVRKKNKSGRATQETRSPTPQPPAKESIFPTGSYGRYVYTDEERAYIKNRCKRALANGPVVVSRLSRDISEKIPWRRPRSVEKHIRKHDLLPRHAAKKSSRPGVRRAHRVTGPATDDIVHETSPPMSSPAREDEPQSDADGSNDTDLESEVQSTSEPPPKAPPRHSAFRAPGRCAFTDTDKEFMIKYLAWAERENLSLHYVSFHMAKLMPWHSVSSIRGFVSKNPDLFRKRNIPSRGARRPLGRASLDYRLQQETNLTRTPNSEGRQSEDSEPQVVTKPTTVKGHTSGHKDQQTQEATSSGTSKAQSAMSQTVIEAMVVALREHPDSHWTPSNSLKRARLWADFAKLHPKHSAESYYHYHVKHRRQLESAARQLIEDENFATDTSKSALPKRISVNSIIDSLVEEEKLEDPVKHLVTKLGSPYDKNDCLAVIQYLADNPSLFYSLIKVPPGVIYARTALWERFYTKYKTRSGFSWYSFHRTYQSALEQAARKLISIRRAREHGDRLQERDSSSMVYAQANGQPGTLTSAERPTERALLSRFQNLLKRSRRDDAESSGPSKRIKVEESLP